MFSAKEVLKYILVNNILIAFVLIVFVYFKFICFTVIIGGWEIVLFSFIFCIFYFILLTKILRRDIDIEIKLSNDNDEHNFDLSYHDDIVLKINGECYPLKKN